MREEFLSITTALRISNRATQLVGSAAVACVVLAILTVNYAPTAPTCVPRSLDRHYAFVTTPY
jgi:hypothetical protein